MAFDDLARHVAARDKRRLARVTTADELIAAAAQEDRRMARTRDLVLGPLLLIGGGVMCLLIYHVLADGLSLTPDSQGAPGTMRYPLFLTVAALGLLAAGAMQTLRGLRGRSR